MKRDGWMDVFRGAIDDCGLRDMGYRGSCFTWKRGKTSETFMRERLDIFLADVEWCNLFQFYMLQIFRYIILVMPR